MLTFYILSWVDKYVGDIAFEDGRGIEHTKILKRKIFLLICMFIKFLFQLFDDDARILINIAIYDCKLERNDYGKGKGVPLMIGSSVENAEHPIKSYKSNLLYTLIIPIRIHK